MQTKEIVNLNRVQERFIEERQRAESALRASSVGWVVDGRRAAEDTWRRLGYPTRHHEEWKYTNLSSLMNAELDLAPAATAAEVAQIKSLLPAASNELAARLVFFNGRFVAELSSPLRQTGLTVEPLSEVFQRLSKAAPDAAAEKEMAVLKRALAISEMPANSQTVFAWINRSFLADGAFLHVSTKQIVDKPVHCVFISGGEGTDGGRILLSHPRIVAQIERFAEVSVFESYLTLSQGELQARAVVNAVTDFFVEDGAQLSYCRLQNESSTTTSLGTSRVYLAREAKARTLNVSLGSQLARQDFHVHLNGEGAEALVDGVYLVQDKQHVDNHTVIEHAVGNTQSRQLYKGILDDESRGVFNGKVIIRPDAQKSDSAQLNNNMILNSKAEIDTKPELEIFADDVKATHGATIGRMNAEELFYFQSRAIAKDQAVRLVALGFVEEVLYRLENESLRKLAAAAVEAKFAGLKVKVNQ